MRSRLLVALLGVSIAGLVACGNGAPTASSNSSTANSSAPGTAAASGLSGASTTKVQATSDLKFSPAAVTVKAGDVVEWTNTGSVAHNVTFDAYPSLTSGTMQQDDTWEIKFTQPGTYQYHCTFHPGMNGTVTVTS